MLHAQQPAEIRGSVVDARGGEALSNVVVQLVGTAFRATTDSAGHFRIPAIPAGDYVLNVSTVGYHLVKKPFHLDAGDTEEFEIILSPETFRQTDTVEVQASPFEPARQDSPSTLVLGGNDAKNLASVLADDPLRSVQGLPGVSSNNDFDARFSLRGADFSRIGLYLDGVLLHAPFHMLQGQQVSGSATAFNGDMVEELELHEGAFPVRFDDRSAGVLDVHTRDGSRTGDTFRIAASASNAGGHGGRPARQEEARLLAGGRAQELPAIHLPAHLSRHLLYLRLRRRAGPPHLRPHAQEQHHPLRPGKLLRASTATSPPTWASTRSSPPATTTRSAISAGALRPRRSC